jgi:hypothetical protein
MDFGLSDRESSGDFETSVVGADASPYSRGEIRTDGDHESIEDLGNEFHASTGSTVADRIQFIIYKACLRKANLSLESANRLVDHHAANGRLIYFYKCDFCDSYHLTKKPAPPRQKIVVI